MVQAELIEEIAFETELPPREVKRVLDSLGRKIAQLDPGDEIKTTAIGIFRASRNKARMGRDPRNGQPVEHGVHTRILYRPAKHIRDGRRAGADAAGARSRG